MGPPPPRVFEVTERRTDLDRIASKAFTSDRDVAHWTALAERLDLVEGDPAWARDAAAVLRDALDRGARAAATDPAHVERNRVAVDSYADAREACADEAG